MGEQLSMLDTMFLELEQFDESAHMHIGAALVFDPLPDGGTPDIAALREHVGERIETLPRFTQQLSAPQAGPLTWLTWEPAEGFDLDSHLHRATLPAPGGDAELYEWLGDFWSHRLDRYRPLWEMTLIDGLEGGRWALATKTHHCPSTGSARSTSATPCRRRRLGARRNRRGPRPRRGGLSGGVFQNRLLLERTAEHLRAAGLRVSSPSGSLLTMAASPTARPRSQPQSRNYCTNSCRYE